MKLPEYDNRPSAGEPLYDDRPAKKKGGASEWDDLKFPLLAVGLPLLMLIAFGSALLDGITKLLSLFK